MSEQGQRVLILSLSLKDAQASQRILKISNTPTKVCTDIVELCREVEVGCGAILLAKEVLNPNAIELINAAVSNQGKWSFAPIIILVSGGDLNRNTKALTMIESLRNTTLIERPVRVNTFISVIHAALADRMRQYEVRELLAALEQSKVDAESASRAKSDFLANMSHEIRTPLGAILGFAELLVEAEISHKEKLNYLQTMKRNGQLLSSLIADVLDLAKVESGKVDIEYIDTSIRELISEIITAHEPQAMKKQISIRSDFDFDVPKIVCTDPLRLKQIVSNVMGNAIKFTRKEGRIDLHIGCTKSNEKKKLTIQVKDFGIGISAEQSARLFQPFTQADSSITRRYGGTGLGLTLSRKLAELLGGDLILKETKVNHGATFEITIDMEQSTNTIPSYQIPDEHISGKVLEGCNILVVDDSVDNQMLITHLVKLSGATVETANDGLEGIQKAMTHRFNVVLMDIQMPRLDGYEAIQRLRSSAYNEPIIALTAYAVKEDIDKCYEAGCDFYLTKPIHRGKLIQTILKCFANGAENAKNRKVSPDNPIHTP